MCGIAGVLDLSGRPVEPELVEAMAARLSHRGPDGRGLHTDGPIGLAHTRLSLIDLDGGAQPMTSEDGRVTVVFNGEIYNFRAVRTELEALGHRFRTRSDTEVIPHAVEEWGEAAVEKLRGMFAFAAWDARRHRLFLARDRLGIKPLYWFLEGQRFFFASELKALLPCARAPRRLDPIALHDYLSLLVPLAPRTLFESIWSLAPGTQLAVENGQVRERRYWVPSARPDPSLDERRALDRLDTTLDAVLADQVVADVPVGAFLSGGIDSSLLVAHLAARSAARHLHHRLRRLRARRGALRPRGRRAVRDAPSRAHRRGG
jgi:asparagine synthase (glutamine-hydrolysing)